MPSTRREFWKNKIEKNRLNDVRAFRELRSMAWRVVTIWECATKGPTRLEHGIIVECLASWLLGEENVLEIPQDGEERG